MERLQVIDLRRYHNLQHPTCKSPYRINKSLSDSLIKEHFSYCNKDKTLNLFLSMNYI